MDHGVIAHGKGVHSAIVNAIAVSMVDTAAYTVRGLARETLPWWRKKIKRPPREKGGTVKGMGSRDEEPTAADGHTALPAQQVEIVVFVHFCVLLPTFLGSAVQNRRY